MTDPHQTDARLPMLLEWAASCIGPCKVVSGDTRLHGRSNVLELESDAGTCFLKMHQELDFWGSEVHGYEQWAPVFGKQAPQLLGVRDEAPYALIVSCVPGVLMENTSLPDDQQLTIWRVAGRALAKLHALPAGESFGPCRRDGSPIGKAVGDAEAYIRSELMRWIEPGREGGWLTPEELRVAQAALELAPAFRGERPVACHRDYNPYNWMVTPEGEWTGVIDFEFAYPELRVIEFARYADWEYLHKPELVDALLAGYGHTWNPVEQEQMLAAHILYALAAVVWGQQNEFLGFAQEGHDALVHLAKRV